MKFCKSVILNYYILYILIYYFLYILNNGDLLMDFYIKLRVFGLDDYMN